MATNDSRPATTGNGNQAPDAEISQPAQEARQVRAALNGRSIVFVGIMGVGKSTIGRRVAALLDLPFADADSEIELAANLSVAEIFDRFGEAYFRAGEKKVINRMLQNGRCVLATGGGAYMDGDTREAIAASAVSVWLDADIDLIMQRVLRRKTRPLLKRPNPRGVIEDLLEERNPIYGLADLRFVSHDANRDDIAAEIVSLLAQKIGTLSPNNGNTDG